METNTNQSSARDASEASHSTENLTPRSQDANRRWAYKNVFGVGISVMFIMMAFSPQSNYVGSLQFQLITLGVLAALYLFFVLFGFFPPFFLRILRTKYSLIGSFYCFLLYSFANFDTFTRNLYILIPASIVAEIGYALMWVAANTHLVKVAVLVSPKLNVIQSHLIGTYTGIFFCFVQVARIPRIIVSSLILFPYDGTISNGTIDAVGIRNAEYAVLSLFCIIGILFALLMTNHLRTDTPFLSSSRKCKLFCKVPLISLLEVMRNKKMLLIAPLSIFTGLELSFTFGTLTVS
jgi:hypothetical protein